MNKQRSYFTTFSLQPNLIASLVHKFCHFKQYFAVNTFAVRVPVKYLVLF